MFSAHKALIGFYELGEVSKAAAGTSLQAEGRAWEGGRDTGRGREEKGGGRRKEGGGRRATKS